MDGEKQEEPLVEERVEEMVAFGVSNPMPIKRKAWFLKPNSSVSPNTDSWVPSRGSFSIGVQKTPRVQFRGWVNPGKQWQQWIDKLRPIYKDLWKKVGIFDSINASTCKHARDLNSLFEVAKYWCGETNTFFFPWGEVTITLEDTMILGGFSLLGDPVRSSKPLIGEIGELAAQMMIELKKFNSTTFKKAEFPIWIKRYFEEGDGGEVEHVAFLSLWLSQFVLPASPYKTVGRHVIPIAIRLARGIKISLAPAVLASLYRDLRTLNNYIASNEYTNEAYPLVLWAPFSLLLLWIWERFLRLRPGSGGAKKFGFSYVMPVLESPDEFRWQPYTIDLYKDDGELRSCLQCMRCCELVGIDCVEHYRPHRVARQFGFDQRVADFVPRANLTWENAWETFDVSGKDIKFDLMPRLYEPNVTLEYSIWWKKVATLLRKNEDPEKWKRHGSLAGNDKKRKSMKISEGIKNEDPKNHLFLTSNKKKRKRNKKRKRMKILEGIKNEDPKNHWFLTSNKKKRKRNKKMKMKKLEEVFDSTCSDGKESEDELTIKKLKMEIALLATRVRELESLGEVNFEQELVSALS